MSNSDIIISLSLYEKHSNRIVKHIETSFWLKEEGAN